MSHTLSILLRRFAAAIPCLPFVAALSATAAAQPPPPVDTVVPELFAGEMDDVGPQFLLQEKPRVRPLECWLDWEYSGTDNVTLASEDPVTSSLLSAQAGVTWHGAPRSWAGGTLAWDTGARVQTYRYGFLANANHPVNFIEIDRNDFDLAGAQVGATWRRGAWLVATGARGALLRSHSTGRRFYEEAVLDAQCLRQWRLTPHTALVGGLETAWRWTRTDSFGLLPDNWNDRAELALVASLDQPLAGRWRLQPSVRLQLAHYTHAQRQRDDQHLFGRVALVRPLGRDAEVRVSLGHERRDSSEALINDYRKWDLALGGSVRWRF